MTDSPTSSPRPHIMVFDSASEIRVLMSHLLEDDYRVTVSTFLPQSFDQIEARQPALLIIDLALHEFVGWDLLAHLALDTLTRRIPVLVTSTNQRLLKRAEVEQVHYGGQSWVVKPFEIEAILAEVRRLIA